MHTAIPFLANDIAAFRDARTGTLRLVEELSQQEFDWSPAEGKWSIGEVLDHILLAERFFQRDLKRFAESSRDGEPVHIRHTLRDLDIGLPFVPRSLMPALELPLSFATVFVPAAMLNFLTSSRLFPMRHPTAASPKRGRPVEDLHQDLRRECERTVEFLEQISESSASQMTVSHPLLGTRNVPELIRFMIEHERRHQGQIADLKESLKMHPESGPAQWTGIERRGLSPANSSEKQCIDRSQASVRMTRDDGSAEWTQRAALARTPIDVSYECEAIRGVYRCISEAWGKGDARGVASHFAIEGDLIDPFGRIARGRDAVAALLAGNFRRMFHGSQIVLGPKTIRFLTAELAVADGTWQVTLPQSPGGQTSPAISGLYTSVLRKFDDAWRVEADRPMLKAPLPPGPPNQDDSAITQSPVLLSQPNQSRAAR